MRIAKTTYMTYNICKENIKSKENGNGGIR